jgi:dihydroorotase
MIKQNMEKAQQEFGNDIPFRYHPIIRSAEACYRSTAHAEEMAEKYGTKLHVAHLSTAKEVGLFSLDSKITAEACVHYLWFSDADYDKKGSSVKCNPAIKTITDRDSLRKAFAAGLLSTLATDHAPHTLEEKKNNYVNAPSGMPLVQHSLHAMLELCIEGHFSLETLVERACHAPARIFNIQKRGFIRSGYFADITIISPNSSWMVEKSNIVSKCGWSPFEDEYFSHKVTHTFVNGKLVFEHGKFNTENKGMALEFDR